MPKCTQSSSETLQFGRIGRKRIEANFNGGDLSSDGGLLLLKAVDDIVGLTRAAAAAVRDRRDRDFISPHISSKVVGGNAARRVVIGLQPD